ncbi:MAG TPA: CinA family protein [Methylophilaceae bacterium]|nr:CinA family protein [Methylophilaceae bacterium]
MANVDLLKPDLLKLSAKLGVALKSRGWMLALAESCTGGGVAECVTAISGSSTWFDRGFVAYSNTAKQEMLGVNPLTLKTHGAVSEHTALEMALGALKHSHANIAAAITGIAGPDGGSAEKPVGTVCFAWATSEGLTEDATLHFSGNREQVRLQAVKTTLEGLIQLTLTNDL